MRLRVEITLGALSIVFDPFPEEDDETEDEGPVGAVTAYDSQSERDERLPPELHIGFRGGEDRNA